MFESISPAVANRMQELQDIDRAQRATEIPSKEWLRAISPDSGRLLALLASSAPSGTFLELGTGSGYSALWLSLAIRERLPECRLVTIEKDPRKAALAQETLALAEVSSLVSLYVNDAAAELSRHGPYAFVFMDHGPHHYEECRELLMNNLLPGGLIVVDNIDSHVTITEPFVQAFERDPRVDCTVLHVGKGVLLGRRIS